MLCPWVQPLHCQLKSQWIFIQFTISVVRTPVQILHSPLSHEVLLLPSFCISSFSLPSLLPSSPATKVLYHYGIEIHINLFWLFFSADKFVYHSALCSLLCNRGSCLMKIGDCAGCVSDCTSALQVLPGDFRSLLKRAQAYETSEK